MANSRFRIVRVRRDALGCVITTIRYVSPAGYIIENITMECPS